MLSEFLSDSKSLQKLLTTRCKASSDSEDLTEEQWHSVFMQAFYFLTQMKSNYYNYCDFHGDNLLVQKASNDIEISLDALQGTDEKIIVNKEDPLVRMIDFDMGGFSKLEINLFGSFTNYNICPGFMSTRAGTVKKIVKSNDLLKDCGHEYDRNTIFGAPIFDQFTVLSNPVDGQWYHFLTYLKVYFGRFPSQEQKDILETIENAIEKFAPKVMLKKIKAARDQGKCDGGDFSKTYVMSLDNNKHQCFDLLQEHVQEQFKKILVQLQRSFSPQG